MREVEQDVTCPYCKNVIEDVEIDVDDETMKVTCDECDQDFIIDIEVEVEVTARKAPCLNGGKHKSVGLYANGKRTCMDCGSKDIAEDSIWNRKDDDDD